MIVIQIVDWRSYLLRSDIKKHTSFKLPTDIAASPKLFHLSIEAKWLWISLIAMATQANKNGLIEQTLDCLEVFTGVNKKTLGASLEALKNVGLIEIDTESVHLSAQIRAESVKLGTQIRAKKESKKTEVIDLTEDELELGTKWREMALKDYPHREDQESWSPYQFALEARKVRDHLKYDHAQMVELFTFIKFDEFWRPNCAKPSGLMKKSSNGLLKIDNLLSSRKTVGQRKAEIFNEQIKTGEYKPDATLDMEFINNYKFFKGNT
jgi:hypothetical protein